MEYFFFGIDEIDLEWGTSEFNVLPISFKWQIEENEETINRIIELMQYYKYKRC